MFRLAPCYAKSSSRCVFDMQIVGNFDAQQGVAFRLSEGCSHFRIRLQARNTYRTAIQLGGSGMGSDITDVAIEGCELHNCTDPSQNSPVIYCEGNSGRGFYPRRITIRGNHIYDGRSGGNGATAGIQLSTSIPGSVVADYRIGPNTIIGPAVRLTNAHEFTANYDPPSLADGAGVTTTATINGAALGDGVNASFAADLQGITLTGYVKATNLVSARFQNESGGMLDLASAQLRLTLEKA
ncbi:MAG: hypothetical protein HC872_06285, partial [Gammaproteobacteria bacterium]|nr:hypothetical protein [Gammaproteobacteria bacterium]